MNLRYSVFTRKGGRGVMASIDCMNSDILIKTNYQSLLKYRVLNHDEAMRILFSLEPGLNRANFVRGVGRESRVGYYS